MVGPASFFAPTEQDSLDKKDQHKAGKHSHTYAGRRAVIHRLRQEMDKNRSKENTRSKRKEEMQIIVGPLPDQ